MSDIHVSALYLYPIKSCAGFAVPSVDITATGPRYDRRWVLAQDGDAPILDKLSQRENARMALIHTALGDGALITRFDGQPDLLIPLEDSRPADRQIDIFGAVCDGIDQGDEAATWFSRALGQPIRLLRMPDESVRPVNPKYAVQPAQTSYTDGYPALLLSQAALDDLNERLIERDQEAVDMRRFRPNIVVDGCEAFAEDTWATIRIGNTPYQVAKPCPRCPIPNIDPDKGETRDTNVIRLLNTYRRTAEGKVMFGQNIIPRGGGTLRVGDRVTVTQMAYA